MLCVAWVALTALAVEGIAKASADGRDMLSDEEITANTMMCASPVVSNAIDEIQVPEADGKIQVAGMCFEGVPDAEGSYGDYRDDSGDT